MRSIPFRVRFILVAIVVVLLWALRKRVLCLGRFYPSASGAAEKCPSRRSAKKQLRIAERKIDVFVRRVQEQGINGDAVEIVRLFPRRFELLGHVVVVKLNPGITREAFANCARAFSECFSPRVVDVVLLDTGGIGGELRKPQLEILWARDVTHITMPKESLRYAMKQVSDSSCILPDDLSLFEACTDSLTFTTHVENGILYSFDVCKVMFCSGNGTERMHFGALPATGEVVVDMFAGIGYFTLPLAIHGSPKVIHAIEKNPTSALFLKYNALQNKTMKSSGVQKDSILAAIVMECVNNRSSDVLRQNSVLFQRLSSPETRNLVYQCCLELLDDSQRCRDVGQLLLSYVSSFPPSQPMLQGIANKCRSYNTNRSLYGGVYQELKAVVEAYLHHKPLTYMLGRTLPAGKEALTFRQNELSSNPDYIQKCNLQPPIERHTEKGKRILSLSSWSDEEFLATAKEKNKTRSRLWTVKYHVVGCKDYVNQLPLECTESLIEQQVRVLNSFWEKYTTNPALLRATSFLIKLMCDAYVSKVPLQSNYSFFRCVSVCYLPTLFAMMNNTYACVRNHVYDILLTLGMHFQLVDTQGIFPGCTEALEEELTWLLLTVLRKQSLREGSDERVWIAAAKCAVAIIPRDKLYLIDGHALYQFMRLPSIAAFHPQLYTTFAEAFARRVLKWDPSGGGGDDDDDEVSISLDEEEFKKCGGQPIARLLHLYRQAMTLSARLAFFQLLFTHAVTVLQARSSLCRLHPHILRRCYRELVKVGFHWHLHSLLFYQSHRVFRELPGDITYDMDVKEMREYKTEAVAIVQYILQIVEEDARLPDVILSTFKGIRAEHMEDSDGLATLISESASMIPAMLRENTDGVLYNIGWRLVLYCMRISRENLASAKSTPILEMLAEKLVSFSGSKDRLELARIRGVCPDVLAALIFLGRKHPNQAVEPFSILIERFLLDTAVVDAQSVMHLYYRLVGSIAIQNGPFKVPPWMDVSQMLCSEQLVTAHSTVDGLGARVLWALYRPLCSVQTLSVCRSRHVLVSLLGELDPVCSTSHALSWKTVMADPYPPVALIGAQKVLQVYGRNAYDRFDEAMNMPQKKEKDDSLYVLAVKVAQLSESRKN